MRDELSAGHAWPAPPYDTIPATWAALAPQVQAKLGSMLIEFVFSDFVSGENYAEEDRLCTQTIRDEARTRCEKILQPLMNAVQSAIPHLFGFDPSPERPDGLDPEWAWIDQDEFDAAEAVVVAAAASAADVARKVAQRRADLALLSTERLARTRMHVHEQLRSPFMTVPAMEVLT